MKQQAKPDRWCAGYINGVFDLAAAESEWIGCSSITAMVYAKENWVEAFSKAYRIKDRFLPVASPESFRQTLMQWLGSADQNRIDQVVSLTEAQFGPAEAVLRAADERAMRNALSGSERGFGAYYFTEDVVFVAFSDCVLALIMGNNE